MFLSDIKIIPLSNGKFSIIDAEYLPLVSMYTWTATEMGRHQKIWYATSSKCGKTIYMHRIVAGDPIGLEVDHKNGDGLNNTIDNLRCITHQQNLFNQRKQVGKTSKYKGVCWFKAGKRLKRWIAQTKYYGKKVHIGYFGTEEEAAHAYDSVVKELFGEYARLNFP